MKKSILSLLFISTVYLSHAQINNNGTTVPNSGADNTVPPTSTYSKPADNMANPTNSTVPGSNGSYTIDPGKPDANNPNTMGSYTVSPSGTGGTTTFSPQTGASTQQKKKTKK